MTVLFALLLLVVRLTRLHLKETLMSTKTRLPDPNTADTDLVPAAAVPVPLPNDYPARVDQIDWHFQTLCVLARQGNRIALDLLDAMYAKYLDVSDQASKVAAILEHIGQGGA